MAYRTFIIMECIFISVLKRSPSHTISGSLSFSIYLYLASVCLCV